MAPGRVVIQFIDGLADLCVAAFFNRYTIRFYERFVLHKVAEAFGMYALRKASHLGTDVRVGGRITVLDPEQLIVGDHVRIGRGSFLFCKGGLHIGDNAQISRNVTIYTANHRTDGDAVPYTDEYVAGPVHIGQSVWIGMNVCVVPGVRIGDGAVIGMGAVVSKDVPKGAVVVGPAQRMVKTRDLERFDYLNEQQEWFGRRWPDL